MDFGLTSGGNGQSNEHLKPVSSWKTGYICFYIAQFYNNTICSALPET